MLTNYIGDRAIVVHSPPKDIVIDIILCVFAKDISAVGLFVLMLFLLKLWGCG